MARVYWITGLAGAGKTTIGSALYEKMHEKTDAIVWMDGDTMRLVFGNDLGYSFEERRVSAMRFSRLCKFLSEQGITVVCCTVSMFDSVRAWNRNNIPEYTEVYIKVSQKTLQQRDQKGLYSGLALGTVAEVTGQDIPCELPKEPDLIIENDGPLELEKWVEEILHEGAFYA